jgi:hypothetical protein
MNLYPVKSSTIEAIGHDGVDKMAVKFRNGTIYEYSGISKNLYDTIINAESVGKRFASLKTTGALNNFVQL